MKWYYAVGDRRVGPLDEHVMRQLAEQGTISSSTLVWHEGLTDWIAAADSEIGKFLSNMPPPVRSDQSPAYQSGEKPGYFQNPESLRTLWLLWIILFAAGFVVSFIIYGIGALLIIPGGIIGFVLLYRFWFIIQPGEPRTTPGKAIGYLFIPFYNIYWLYVAWVGLAKDMNETCRKYNITATVNEGMALAYYILVLLSWIPYVGFVTAIVGFIIEAIVMKQLVEASIKIIRSG